MTGALLIYCAGCFLALQPHMDSVAERIRRGLPDLRQQPSDGGGADGGAAVGSASAACGGLPKHDGQTKCALPVSGLVTLSVKKLHSGQRCVCRLSSPDGGRKWSMAHVPQRSTRARAAKHEVPTVRPNHAAQAPAESMQRHQPAAEGPRSFGPTAHQRLNVRWLNVINVRRLNRSCAWQQK